ncbi:MAG: autotransporter-associated beta strand repeat-containing protein, partial [Roseovarius sp.]
ITKNGTGTLVVEGNKSYTGNTTVNDGILQANAANALGNSTVTVNGGSLLVTASNAITDSKGVTLAGGTLAFNGTVTDSIGALTLSADSIIDLGTGSVSASFADLAMGLYNLSIYNWTGTTLWEGGDGNNTDKIYFNTSLSSSELQRISFYSDFGSSFVGTGFQFGAGLYQNEVIPVPEPETWATAALLLIGGGIWMWRKRRAESTCSVCL